MENKITIVKIQNLRTELITLEKMHRKMLKKKKKRKRENQAQMSEIILFLKDKEMRMDEFAKECLSFSDFIPESLAVSTKQ